MTRAPVELEIERLDIIGRANGVIPAPARTDRPTVLPSQTILNRIDYVLDMMVYQEMGVRAIYLDRGDLLSLLSVQRRIERPLSYRGHPVREGKSSRISSDRGVARSIGRAG